MKSLPNWGLTLKNANQHGLTHFEFQCFLFILWIVSEVKNSLQAWLEYFK